MKRDVFCQRIGVYNEACYFETEIAGYDIILLPISERVTIYKPNISKYNAFYYGFDTHMGSNNFKNEIKEIIEKDKILFLVNRDWNKYVSNFKENIEIVEQFKKCFIIVLKSNNIIAKNVFDDKYSLVY